ncbi:hypothetical protein ACUODF_41085, partial [Escherichia coli]
TADFTSVSDKARAIGGGVLEALMMLNALSKKVILRKVLCCLKWKLPPRLLALAQVVKH